MNVNSETFKTYNIYFQVYYWINIRNYEKKDIRITFSYFNYVYFFIYFFQTQRTKSKKGCVGSVSKTAGKRKNLYVYKIIWIVSQQAYKCFSWVDVEQGLCYSWQTVKWNIIFLALCAFAYDGGFGWFYGQVDLLFSHYFLIKIQVAAHEGFYFRLTAFNTDFFFRFVFFVLFFCFLFCFCHES